MFLKFYFFGLGLVVVCKIIVEGGFVVICIGWMIGVGVGGGVGDRCDGGFVMIIGGEFNCGFRGGLFNVLFEWEGVMVVGLVLFNDGVKGEIMIIGVVVVDGGCGVGVVELIGFFGVRVEEGVFSEELVMLLREVLFFLS